MIFIFLDGVGIGSKDRASNPFFADRFPTWERLSGGSAPYLRNARRSTDHSTVTPINATLGVSGYPQSGTGQTTILTGVNASKQIGKHFGPYPYSTLRPILKEQNMFLSLHRKAVTSSFANAYPQRYFDYLEKHPIVMGSNALAWKLSGFRLRNHEDLRNGEAVSADITNERWPDMGYPNILRISPQEAGARLTELSRKYQFVFYEYYLTDKAGHHQSMSEAVRALKDVDGLLEGLVESADLKSTLVLITSDHGNIEDLSVRTHTRNPVPLLAVGNGHQSAMKLKSLVDIKSFIVNQF